MFSLDELKEEFQERILFGFLEGIWSLDLIYQGQRPIPPQPSEELDETAEDDCDKEEESLTEEQEHYRRDFFAMLEDVIELSNDYPSVLIDPEFSLVNHN